MRNLCPCNLASVTERKVFGSVARRHLTLDKAAGWAPWALQVIYCWRCSREEIHSGARIESRVARRVPRRPHIRKQCHSGALISVVASV